MNIYVIEARSDDGSLDLSGRQPEEVFGHFAVTGIKEHVMAQVVWRYAPDAVLDGREVVLWPAKIDPRWVARRKTW